MFVIYRKLKKGVDMYGWSMIMIMIFLSFPGWAIVVLMYFRYCWVRNQISKLESKIDRFLSILKKD